MLGGIDVMNPGVLYKQAMGFKAPPEEAFSEQVRFAGSTVSDKHASVATG